MRYDHNGVLQIDIQDWELAGLSYEVYKNAKRRRLIIATKGDPGKPVEIEFDSIPDRYKDAIIAHFGDPGTYAHDQVIAMYLPDTEDALGFFLNHLNADQVDAAVARFQWIALAAMISNECLPEHVNKHFMANHFEAFFALIKAQKIKLPTSYSKLKKMVKAYEVDGIESLLSGKMGNVNSVKIHQEAGDYLVACFSLPTKPTYDLVFANYNLHAKDQGWEVLKSKSAIYTFLNKPEVKRRWFGPRHGYLLAKEKYGYTLKTKLPTFRDALWYSDGTKLNYYIKRGSKVETLNVYEVVDVFSECLLGYCISQTEDFVAQYEAYKMAIEFSQAKPYQIGYDGQGGHKKNKSFLSKLSRVGFAVQPYNGKSKTIESVFGRMQKTMRSAWYSTGQNITAKTLDSRANQEFIAEHKKDLPQLLDVIKEYESKRQEWNNAIHPTHKIPRKQLYLQSQNPHHQPVGYIQMVELFWLESKPIKYYTHGISITIQGEQYEFEVLKDGMPDVEFRRKYIDARFVIKYDPANLGHVRLYSQKGGSLKFVDVAETRLVVPRAIVDYAPGDRERISALLDVRRGEIDQMKKQAADTAEATGVRAEDLVNSFGSYTKIVSNMDHEEDDEQHWTDKV